MLFPLAKNARELNSKEMSEEMVIISDASFWYRIFFFFKDLTIYRKQPLLFLLPNSFIHSKIVFG